MLYTINPDEDSVIPDMEEPDKKNPVKQDMKSNSMNLEDMKKVAELASKVDYAKATLIVMNYDGVDESGADTDSFEVYIGGHVFVLRHYDGFGGHICTLYSFDGQRLADGDNLYGPQVNYSVIREVEELYYEKFESDISRETDLKPAIEALEKITGE